MKFNIRVRAVLCFVLMLTLLLPAQIFAAGDTASFTVSYIEDESPIVGAEFDIYRIAYPADGSYLFCDDFADLQVSLDIIDGADLLAFAETAAAYVDLNKSAPTASSATNDDGQAVFTDLSFGIYLVRGRDFSKDGITYVNKPFAVFLPDTDEQGNLIYDVVANPKYETRPDKPDGEFTTCKVLKSWKNDSAAKRPKSITVYLLRDGEVFDTVILNSANNWRYTWDKLDSSYKWTVAEKVPDNYTVTITKEGVTYLITNTGKDEPPKKEEKPPKLPQTGQLWWPVPILAVLGLMFILIGCIRRRGDGYEA